MRRVLVSIVSLTLLMVGLGAAPAIAEVEIADTSVVSLPVPPDSFANSDSAAPSTSADGNRIAYMSWASNLVPGDTNGFGQIYLYDMSSGVNTRVSVDSSGIEGNGESEYPVVSADGSKVVYTSWASNLVPGDTNGTLDVFLYDVATGVTTRVSVGQGGTEADSASCCADLSADGRFVVFVSGASNLVDGDTNGVPDVFRHDVATGITRRVSLDSSGTQGDGQSDWPSVSADGNVVVFGSHSSNLVAADTNGVQDVFRHDVETGVTTRVSVHSSGVQGDNRSLRADVSADGSVVVFESDASNLVGGDTNGAPDVFLHEVGSGATTLVSRGVGGDAANGESTEAALASGGSVVVYMSTASDLVPGVTNGAWDVFWYEVATGTTRRVSVSSSGGEGDGESALPSVSTHGNVVFYHSGATNLAVGDDNGSYDVFRTVVQRAPLVEDLSVSVAESLGAGSEVGVVSASDPDDDVLSFEITGGNGSNLFAVGDTSGVVTVAAPLDFETEDSHVLTVEVTDGHFTEEAEVTVTVTDANDAPVATDVSSVMSETVPVGTLVATVDADDQDDDTLSFAVTDGDEAGLFAIDAATGVVTTAGELNYEIAASHTLTVTVSDGELSGTATVTVTVADVEEPEPFDDDNGSVFEVDIEWLADVGVTQGCGDRLFCPESNVTRGQMAAFLNRALNLPATTEDFFTDDDTSIFEDDINRLAAAGITRGCSDTEYCPEELVTRGQMAAFLVRGFGFTDDGGGDWFGDDDTSIFEGHIDRLATAGVTKGCNPPDNTNYCPSSNVTRGQMAAFLRRAMN